MQTKTLYIALAIIAVLASSSCGAATPEPSATPQPTNTPPTTTDTPAPTSTPRPTDVPTTTPPPPPASQPGHTKDSFHLTIPDGWDVVDMRGESVRYLYDSLEGVEAPWAQSLTHMFSPDELEEDLKLWAMHSVPQGTGYATLSVVQQSRPFPTPAEDLCSRLPTLYERMGIAVTDADCSLEINGLDVARFTLRLGIGPVTLKELQYAYLGEEQVWTLSFAVDETHWSAYESAFVKAAESFELDGEQEGRE